MLWMMVGGGDVGGDWMETSDGRDSMILGDGRGSMSGMYGRLITDGSDGWASSMMASHEGLRWLGSSNLEVGFVIGFLVKLLGDFGGEEGLECGGDGELG